MRNVLKFKKILVVDDEPGIVENLEEILDMCFVDSAFDFRKGQKCLKTKQYDAAVLDIMGVRGYKLLEIATEKGIPAVILTAHAFSPDNLVKSIKGGAHAYVPKWKVADIDIYVDEAIKASEENEPRRFTWFERLKPYFDEKFGPDWKKSHEAFWREFDDELRISKKELEEAM
ncbi:MAG: response regulator [Deltaproteobacteria bacterium]|nr:response regulator [Deltaproteobacteria bacterium]